MYPNPLVSPVAKQMTAMVIIDVDEPTDLRSQTEAPTSSHVSDHGRWKSRRPAVVPRGQTADHRMSSRDHTLDLRFAREWSRPQRRCACASVERS
jgi:hypothetical protein